MKEHPDANVVEMDCVEGKKNESRAILTFTFRNCNLMLMFLLEYQDQECVMEVLRKNIKTECLWVHYKANIWSSVFQSLTTP